MRSTLLIAVTLLLPIFMIGQSKIIVHTGLTLSKVKTSGFGDQPPINKAPTSYPRLGAEIGVDLRVSESQMFTQFGLGYQMFSSNDLDLEENGYSIVFSGHSKLHQVRAKIMVGYYLLPKNKFLNLYLTGGVHPYYIFKQSQGSDGLVYELDEIAQLNVGASLGAGIDLFKHVNLEIRREVSLGAYLKTERHTLNSYSATIGIMFL